MAKSLTTRDWTARRARWQQRLPLPCLRCGQLVQPWDDWDLDHATARALGGSNEDTRPSHRTCNRRAGGQLSRELAQLGARTARAQATNSDDDDDDEKHATKKKENDTRVFSESDNVADTTREARIPPPLSGSVADSADLDVVTPDPSDPVWDRCGWLDELRLVPPDAAWPRLMSAPHPDAVGSYGADACDWLSSNADLDLRWWQRLVVTRALEHDADGRLVWIECDVSTPRQVGKSVTIRALATWRIHQADLFGEPQTVLHTGKDLPVCKEVMRPARIWARSRGGYKVREANGAEEISTGESRWIIRARFSVYGYPVAVGLVDECWGVEPEIVEDGVEPTLGDRVSPQLWLVSTAHRKASSLFPLRRAAAIASLDAPGSSLIMEWSARRDASIDDRDAWRSSSPHWSDMRERLLAAKLDRVRLGVSEDPDEDDPVESFRSQYLNVWPSRTLVTSTSEEPLVELDEWKSLADLSLAPSSTEPVSVGIEDWFGLGASAVAAQSLVDGRIVVWGSVFPDRESAIAWAAWLTDSRPGSTVIAGTSLPVESVRDALPDVDVEKASPSDMRSGLALIRILIRQGRLRHGDDPDFASQLSVCRVAQREGGLVIPHRANRTDLIRGLATSVRSVVDGRVDTPLPRPAIF